jgi:protein arginine kinase activator
MTETPKEDPQTCQECGQAPASVHIRRIAAGKEVEVHLCLGCAQARGLESQETEAPHGALDPVSLLFKNLNEIEGGGGVCPRCGLSYSQFRETARLGCARCYQTFADELKPLIRRVHGEVRHVGKVPIREGEAYEHSARLRRLNEDLEKAIGAEDYERAADIRDLIQELESAGSSEREP